MQQSKSDQNKVLDALLSGGVVSSLWGQQKLRTCDTRKYISNLIKAGYIVDSQWAQNPVNKKMFKFYFIKAENRNK
jgi:hypothetical protein